DERVWRIGLCYECGRATSELWRHGTLSPQRNGYGEERGCSQAALQWDGIFRLQPCILQPGRLGELHAKFSGGKLQYLCAARCRKWGDDVRAVSGDGRLGHGSSNDKFSG